jgi:hypothetical protein
MNERGGVPMKVHYVILGSMMAALAACPLAAQTPVLGGIEAPYPALQSPVHIAGGAYGPGAVTYGPVARIRMAWRRRPCRRRLRCGHRRSSS